jgi:hypothetical protein
MGIGKKLLIGLGAAVIAAAGIVGAVFTGGATAVAAGVGLAAMFSAVGVAGIVAAGVAATIVTVSHAVILTKAAVVGIRARRNKGKAQSIKGRHEPIPKDYERKEKNNSRLLS